MNCDFAFPFLVKPGERIPNPGLTKRELFAALFTAAAIANPDITAPVGTIVSDSITVADRLITALNDPDEDEEDAS